MERVLGLRRDERATVGLASAIAATGAAGLTIAASSVDALLFSHGGVDDLPTLYVLLGVTMFAASIGVAALLGRLGRGRAFLLVPLAIGVIAGISRAALAADAGWIYPALWLVRGAAEFLVGLAVWGLAGLVTDTRQAKRFFPLIGAAAVLGQVIGGFATKPLAAWLGTENLVLVWMATLLVVAILGRTLVARADPAATRPRRLRPPVLAELRDGARYALRSPLLRWMSIGSILFSLLFFSLYLPFSRAAVARYPDPQDLAGFLGVFTAIATGVTLVLALLVMNRLLSRLGVPTVMMVLPILYLVAFGVLTISATFALLLAFRFAQVVWLQGGASTAWEAVINTVPGERRDRVRAFLYGGPTQIGTVLAGVVTLIGERAVSPRVLFALGLVAAIAAVVTMTRVRRAYTAELLVALREGRPEGVRRHARRGRALRARPRRSGRRLDSDRRDVGSGRRRAARGRGAPGRSRRARDGRGARRGARRRERRDPRRGAPLAGTGRGVRGGGRGTRAPVRSGTGGAAGGARRGGRAPSRRGGARSAVAGRRGRDRPGARRRDPPRGSQRWRGRRGGSRPRPSDPVAASRRPRRGVWSTGVVAEPAGRRARERRPAGPRPAGPCRGRPRRARHRSRARPGHASRVGRRRRGGPRGGARRGGGVPGTFLAARPRARGRLRGRGVRGPAARRLDRRRRGRPPRRAPRVAARVLARPGPHRAPRDRPPRRRRPGRDGARQPRGRRSRAACERAGGDRDRGRPRRRAPPRGAVGARADPRPRPRLARARARAPGRTDPRHGGVGDERTRRRATARRRRRRTDDRDPDHAPDDGTRAVPPPGSAVRRPSPAGPAADRGDRVRAFLRRRRHDRGAGRSRRRDAHHRERLRDGDPPGSRRTPAGARRPLGRRCDRRDGRRDGRREDGVARREG